MGISQTTAAEMVLTTNEFKAITDPKQYACYAGVVPFEHSSGQYKGKAKVSQIANKQVKSLLHLAGPPVRCLISDSVLSLIERLL